jgi:hypothetical protein
MNRWKILPGFICVCVILSLGLIGCQSSPSPPADSSPAQTPVTTADGTSPPPSDTPSTPPTHSSSTMPEDAPPPMGPKILWSFLGAPRIGPMVDSDGNVYFGTWEKLIYSLTPSGEVRWSFAVSEELHRYTTSIVIDRDGLVYVSTMHTLYALDNAGNLRWKLSTPEVDDMAAEAQAMTVGSDGTIYLASVVYGKGKVGLCAIGSDGQIKWQFVGSGSGVYLGIGQAGTIYLGTRGGSLYAVQPGGTVAWELKPSEGYVGMYGAPAVATDGTVYIRTEASELLLAVSPDGAEKWRSNVAPNQVAAFGADGTIYVGGGASGWDYTAGLFALNPSGEIEWQVEVPRTGSIGDIVSTRAVVGDDGTIYFGTLGHGHPSPVYAVNTDGSVKWRRNVDDEVTDLVMGSNGILYAASADGCLYALSTTEEEALATPAPPWNDPPAATTGILGWRMITRGDGTYLQVRLAEPDYHYWQLVSPGGKETSSMQSNSEVLDLPMGLAPAAGHYSILDSTLDDATERMSLDFTGAELSLLSVRGVGDYVYLEVKNTGDLPTVIRDVNVIVTDRDEYHSNLSTWGMYGIGVIPGSTTIVSAHYLDPRPGGPWGEEGTPIDVTLSYYDFDISDDVVLLEQQTTLGPLLFPRNNQ